MTTYTHLTPEQLAQRLQVSVRLLEQWRYRRVGPAFIRVGRLVRYPVAEVDRWMEEHLVGGEK